MGLDAAALRAALGWLVGDRRPRRPARVRRVDRPRARRRGGAAQPAARHHPGAAGAGVALHAVEQAVRDTPGVARHRPRRLPHRRRRHARPGGRAASRHRGRPDRARPGVGGQALGLRAAVALGGAARAHRRTGRPVAVRDLLRARRALREPLEPVARRAAAPRGAGRRPRARAAGPAGGVPRVAAGPGAASAVRRARRGAGGRGAGRARPRRRLRPRGRRRLGAAGRPRDGRARRCPAGRVQPAGPGLGAAALAPRPAGRHRLRRLPRPAAGHPAGRGRAADRPRRRAVAAVVGAAGRVAGPGHLRALRLRRHARRADAGGVARPGRW